MDIPAAAAGPWLALGVVLGITLIALSGVVAALVLRRSDRPARTSPAVVPQEDTDDLPAFLENPPGAGPDLAPRRVGWVSLGALPPAPLTAAPLAPAPQPSATGRWSATSRALAAMLVTALVLVGAAAAVAVGAQGEDSASPAPTTDRHPAPADPVQADPAQLGARFIFGGVVLERRAVGVTATYPRVALDGSGPGARATVELPTFNCLMDAAPTDPDVAGCTRIWTEYAELSTPALEVTRDGDRLQLAGRFATWLRPNGSPPVPTGRSYELTITAAPTGPRATDGWMPADGVLQLAEDRAPTVDGGAELRYSD